MNQTIRPTSRFALVAFVFAAFPLATFAQPVPSATPASSTSGPGGGGPVIAPSAMPPPAMPPGNVSADELKKYSAFQQQINEEPAIKDLMVKIAKLTQEIQQLRAETNAIREKLTAANPEMKKIQDKITSAMRTRTTNGPMPLLAPAPSPTK